MRPGQWIVYVLTALLAAVLLELNHSRWIGWMLFGATVLLIPIVAVKLLNGNHAFLLWITSIAVYAGIFLLAWPNEMRVPAVEGRAPEATGVIATDKGDITGVYNRDHTVEVYAGIPYAAPPVGSLRWRKPQDHEAWDGVMACDSFAPMSMQKRNLPLVDSLIRIIGYHDYQPFATHHIEPVSEDSLYLNVWKPAGDQTGLPVLVYIHGGSLQTGESWYSDYRGEAFAADGAVMVTMGYRLGVFGFLAEEEFLAEEGTTGNYGLLDQIKALEWVQKNIAAFGGDPDNVTLVGESAGAVCVDALCVSPLAQGLFQRAILESSTVSADEPPHSFRLFDEALASGKRLKERYGCTDANALRDLPADQLVREQDTQHHITVDGMVLPDTPARLRRQGIHNEQAVLHGFNGHESSAFIVLDHARLDSYESRLKRSFGGKADAIRKLYPASTNEEADRYWAEIYGAQFFNYSHYCLNRLAAEQNIPVYEYLFTKQNGALSDWHSGELIYAFGNIPPRSRLYDETDRELSRIMHAYWLNFAKTGDPNGAGLPVFPQNPTSQKILRLDETVEVIEEPYLKLYRIFDGD